MPNKHSAKSAYLRAIARDNSQPIDQVAIDLWQRDLTNPLRWLIRPVLHLFFAALLHVVWLLKRLPLPQFSAHKTLQNLICWFCEHFVSKEANMLILRHYATESNILNFLAANSPNISFEPIKLYPKTIDDMKQASFVDHDQELFRLFAELGSWHHPVTPVMHNALNWELWEPINTAEFKLDDRWTQCLDFESAHALFMCLFCLLLTKEEYRDAINGFNLDQSIAIRIGDLIGDKSVVEMAYNKHPHYLVGPWNLGQRFLMHGFFTEHLHAKLEQVRGRL